MLPKMLKSFCLLFVISVNILQSNVFAYSADPSALMSNYSLYGKDSLIIEEHTITSDAGWVGTDNLFKIIGNWAEEFGSVVKVGNTFNGGGGSATYHDTVYVKGSLTGGLPPSNLLVNPASFPDPEFPEFTSDSINVNPSNDVIIENSTTDILPGSYGTINIGANNSNASIGVFKEGVYEVDSLMIWGSLQIDKDSAAYCRILVKSYFNIGSSSQNNHIVVQNGSFGRVLIHVTGEGNLNINPHTRIDATIVAPKMDLKINSDVTLNGQLLAKSITTGQDFNGNTGIFTSFVTTGISLNNSIFSEDPSDLSPFTEDPGEINSRVVSLGVTLADISDSGGTVDYSISGGTAAIGFDFDTLTSIGASGGSGTLTFLPGTKTPKEDIMIYIIDDTLNDSIESFTVQLSNPSEFIHLQGNLNSTSWAVSIINEDSLVGDTGTIDTGTIDTNSHYVKATDDNIIVDLGGTVSQLSNGSLSILANDESTDDPMKVSAILKDPIYGNLTWDSTGTFTYVHTGSIGQDDSFIYQVIDSYGSLDTGLVIIAVDSGGIDTGTIDTTTHELNANDDAIVVAEGDTALTLANGAISVLVNDESTDAPMKVIAIITAPVNGSLQLDSAGTFIYIHTNTSALSDSFVYKVTDTHGNIDSATVTVTVQQKNKYDPIALNDTIAVLEGGIADTLITGDTTVLHNDSDSDAVDINLLATVISGVSHGTLTFNSNGTFVYVHDGSEFTSDSFIYEVTDKAGHKDTATVAIVITAINDHKPIANDDVIFVKAGSYTNVLINGDSSFLDNDVDLDPGDTIKIFTTSSINFGTLSVDTNFNVTGKFIFQLNDTTDSIYSFIYVITDLAGNKDTATVYVTTVLKAGDHSPVANNDSIVVNEGATVTILVDSSESVLENDTDLDLDSLDMLSVSLLYSTSYGNITLNKNGTFSYTHDGSESFKDEFTYVVSDAGGNKDTAVVSITIIPVNDNAPIAEPENLVVYKGETVVVTTAGDSSVLANDKDADLNGMNTVKVVLVSDVSNGTLILDSITGKFSYTHNGTETYADSFSYMLNDGVQDGNVVTVNIKIIDGDIGNTVISSAYYDGNGDGIVDTVIINLAAPVNALSLALNAEWVGESLIGSTVNAAVNPNIMTQVIADISGAFASVVDNKTSGTLEVGLVAGSDTISAIATDSAAPVLTYAHLTFGSDETQNDTLIVKFSEAMNAISSSTPLTFYKAVGDDYSMQLSLLEALSEAEFKYEVLSIDAGYTPSSLDSVNINHQSSVSDINGVVQLVPLNQKVKLNVNTQPVDIKIISLITDIIPDDLKVGNKKIDVGSVVILDPISTGNNEAIANELLESSTYKAVIFDMVGNIVAECDDKKGEDDDLAIGIVTVGGKKMIAANWSNNNKKGRKVGGGTYLMIIQMKGEKNSEYKSFVRVKALE